VIGNLLLVLGFVLLVGERGAIDRTSAFVSLGTVLLAVLLLLVPAVPGFHRSSSLSTSLETGKPSGS
jgi:hypothetical protein